MNKISNFFHSSNSRRGAGGPGPQPVSHPEGGGGVRQEVLSPQPRGGDTSAKFKVTETDVVIGRRGGDSSGTANQQLATTQLWGHLKRGKDEFLERTS